MYCKEINIRFILKIEDSLNLVLAILFLFTSVQRMTYPKITLIIIVIILKNISGTETKNFSYCYFIQNIKAFAIYYLLLTTVRIDLTKCSICVFIVGGSPKP